MQKKWIWIVGIVGVGGIVGIFLYYLSRRKVAEGQEYDLAEGIYQVSSSGGTATAANPATGEPAAPRYAMDSHTEPAASLIARQADALRLSADTMNIIKSRIGYNSRLFDGIDNAVMGKIKQAFRTTFNINPDSLLSYPTWDVDQSPELLPLLTVLGADVVPGTFAYDFTFARKKPAEFYIIRPWLSMDFRNFGINPNLFTDFAGLKRFYKNAAAEINRLQDAVRYEAAQYLRRQGWRFTDFGDVNN